MTRGSRRDPKQEQSKDTRAAWCTKEGRQLGVPTSERPGRVVNPIPVRCESEEAPTRVRSKSAASRSKVRHESDASPMGDNFIGFVPIPLRFHCDRIAISLRFDCDMVVIPLRYNAISP
jgi:hypothetical protein